MAMIHTTKVFVSSISEKQFVGGLRYQNDELNKKIMEAVKKKYFKKNGKPRKNSPYKVLPLDPKEYCEANGIEIETYGKTNNNG